jgi:hypothetical protein
MLRRRLEMFLVLAFLCSVGVAGCDEEPDQIVTPVDLSPWPAARELHPAAREFPDWAFSLHLWPFDILSPGMTEAEIDERLDLAADAQANAVIVYIEEEHMFGTFVDDAGFAGVRLQIEHLTVRAGELGLRTIVYVNGLEVMTRGAYDSRCGSTGVPTMAGEHPDWVQLDLDGEPIVYACQDSDWLLPDWEDAWISPYSGYRDLFRGRIAELAEAGVDGIYIDATFLPGYQAEGPHRWGSTDPGFTEAFRAATGFDMPAEADLGSPEFRAFLAFRHQAVADYLADLGDAARAAGLVPFWESSTNDTTEGTLLGNDTAVTGRAGLGFSPEVEAEGDWFAAFRMGKAARELNLERPMIYLGWPETSNAAMIELAIALAHSGTYYPTADIPVPPDAFEFMEEIGSILDRRIPYSGGLALVYSTRNQDLTYNDERFFAAWEEAAYQLLMRHLPFRIVPLEYVPEDGLDGFSTAVLPCLESISDEEGAVLAGVHVVSTVCEAGVRDEDWSERSTPLRLEDAGGLDQVRAALPFGLEAPVETLIELYGDREGEHRMYLFAVSPLRSGRVVLTAAEGSSLTVRAYSPGRETTEQTGETVTVPISTVFVVLEVSES